MRSRSRLDASAGGAGTSRRPSGDRLAGAEPLLLTLKLAGARFQLALAFLEPALSLGYERLLPVDTPFLFLLETAHGERRHDRAERYLRRCVPLTGGGVDDGDGARYRDLVATHHQHLAQNLVP